MRRDLLYFDFKESGELPEVAAICGDTLCYITSKLQTLSSSVCFHQASIEEGVSLLRHAYSLLAKLTILSSLVTFHQLNHNAHNILLESIVVCHQVICIFFPIVFHFLADNGDRTFCNTVMP